MTWRMRRSLSGTKRRWRWIGIALCVVLLMMAVGGLRAETIEAQIPDPGFIGALVLAFMFSMIGAAISYGRRLVRGRPFDMNEAFVELMGPWLVGLSVFIIMMGSGAPWWLAAPVGGQVAHSGISGWFLARHFVNAVLRREVLPERPPSEWSEQVDLAGYSPDELRGLLSAIQTELARKAESAPSAT